MFTIRFYQDLDKERWDSYILNHPNGTFFHLIGWKTVVEKTFHHKSHYLIAESNGNSTNAINSTNPKNSNNPSNSINPSNPINSTNPIVGILPLFSVKSFLFCKSLVSLPFAAYGGILADNQQVASQLFDKAKEITCSDGLDYLELRNKDGMIDHLPLKELYVFFRRRIFEDLESNMNAILRKSRRMIRVGEKAGLTHKFGGEELLPEFYDIFARSYHRLGSPVFSIKIFKNLLEELKEQTNILLIRSREGKPISSVLTFFYKDQVLPYFAGSLFEYRDLGRSEEHTSELQSR